MTKEEYLKILPKYIKQWKDYLVDKWGLNADFAEKLSNFILWCAYFGIRPTITSGYRSPEYQAKLVEEYKKGNPNVITPLPPGKSLHNNRTWFGSPDSLACDIVFNPDNRNNTAIFIARQLGIAAAGEPDYVHFGARSGTL